MLILRRKFIAFSYFVFCTSFFAFDWINNHQLGKSVLRIRCLDAADDKQLGFFDETRGYIVFGKILRAIAFKSDFGIVDLVRTE